MEGWLLKRGQMGTAKRRYFVLEGPVLAYYGSHVPEERQAPRGQLVLGPDSRVVELTGRRGACACACLVPRGMAGETRAKIGRDDRPTDQPIERAGVQTLAGFLRLNRLFVCASTNRLHRERAAQGMDDDLGGERRAGGHPLAQCRRRRHRQVRDGAKDVASLDTVRGLMIA